MRRLSVALLGASLLLAALMSPTSAQAPRIDGPQPSRLTPAVVAESSTIRVGVMQSVRPNQWKRGALIGGGIATALFVALVASSDDCGASPCMLVAVGIAPAAFLIGAFPGALIGSFFPRDTL